MTSRLRLAVRPVVLALALPLIFVAGCSGSSSPSPAPSTSSSSSPAAAPPTQTFHHISATKAKKLETRVPLVAGVQNVTYYAHTKTFQVFFRATATQRDLQAVKDLIRQI